MKEGAAEAGVSPTATAGGPAISPSPDGASPDSTAPTSSQESGNGEGVHIAHPKSQPAAMTSSQTPGLAGTLSEQKSAKETKETASAPSLPSLPSVQQPQRRTRRIYQQVALVAVRETRILGLYWTRRGRKTTTLGDISFDEMSATSKRTVIAASASLLLGSEIVGMTLTAAEQAAIVGKEAAAIREVFTEGADAQSLKLQVANSETGRELAGLTPEDFAELYQTSKMEMRLYHDRTAYSRLRIIAPNPATARGWGGTVLRDEAGYTPTNLENDLRVATKPIFDTDPTFKLIYASNLSKDDRHPWFEDTMPPADLDLPVNPRGNFYRGQTGMLIHRVTLEDAYAAGHVLYDEKGGKLSYADFIGATGNKLGKEINYTLEHKSGGTAVIDLIALLTAQKRGVGECALFYIDSDADFSSALAHLRARLGDGAVGIGFDVATTTKGTSNPSGVTVTERNGNQFTQHLVCAWKERKPQIARERVRRIIETVRSRPTGGPARRLCIDASNERYFAEETRDELASLIPVELVISGASVHPPGYTEPTNYKTWLGDLYSAEINDNHYTLPPENYLKKDHRIVIKDRGLYMCDPEADGAHGDTFDSGKLAQHALLGTGGALESVAGIVMGRPAGNSHHFKPRRLRA